MTDKIQDLSRGLSLNWSIPDYKISHHGAVVSGLTTLASSPIKCTDIGELKLIMYAHQEGSTILLKVSLKATDPVHGLGWTISIGDGINSPNSKGTWMSENPHSSSDPLTMRLSEFTGVLEKITDVHGTLRVTAEVQPSFVPPVEKSSRGGTIRTPKTSVAKDRKRLAGKAPKSDRESTVRKQKIALGKKLLQLQKNDVVAIRNPDGGLWLGRLERVLDLVNDDNAKVRWFEQTKTGNNPTFVLTNGQDIISSKSIHPEPISLVQVKERFSFEIPSQLDEINELYQ